MIGAKPSTTFAVGIAMDSRMYASSTVTVPPPVSFSVRPHAPFMLGPSLALPSVEWQVEQGWIYPGQSHAGVIGPSFADMKNWIGDRFTGASAASRVPTGQPDVQTQICPM